jgi:hypothetical protein
MRLHQKYLLRARRSQRGALENSLGAHWCFGWCFELGRVWVVGGQGGSALSFRSIPAEIRAY